MGVGPEQQVPENGSNGLAPDVVPPLRRIVVGHEVPPIRVGDGYGSGVAQGNGQIEEELFFPEEQAAPDWFEERMRTEALSIAFGKKLAVKEVSLPVNTGQVLALIGPSGCGKTTLLRSLNKLVDLTPTATRTGRILIDGEDVDLFDDTQLRRRVGMLFQQPNPFPMSIFDNIAYGLRERGSKRPRKKELEPLVVDALERAGLWDEVSDNLDHPALSLSGGQQQRLCIARSLAVHPEVLLLDEPCSALDPISTAIIEETVVGLKDEMAIVIVTHNLQQAERVADQVAFMYLGDLVEYGAADQVFNAPMAERTKDYVRGDFG
jgi:phosphate transport system ATP-binding protein